MRRFYRDWVKKENLYLETIVVKETDLQILTDQPLDKDFFKKRINFYRGQIEDYIRKDKRFLTSLKPLSVEIDAPLIVKEMSKQTKKANVGPMAAVAGAMAEFLGKDLLKKGYQEVIIENGGDIFLASRKTRTVGIYPGPKNPWQNLALKIDPLDTPLGICTSSATLGHSLSFGKAESVVIISKNTSLADAVATATCNRVQSKKDLEKALKFAKGIKGILGVVIILNKNLLAWGKVEFLTFRR